MIFAGLLFLASGALLSASNETSERHEVELALSKHVQAGAPDADQNIQGVGGPPPGRAGRPRGGGGCAALPPGRGWAPPTRPPRRRGPAACHCFHHFDRSPRTH